MALTLPGIESLKAYERRWLARELVVGLVLTALLVPQAWLTPSWRDCLR